MSAAESTTPAEEKKGFDQKFADTVEEKIRELEMSASMIALSVVLLQHTAKTDEHRGQLAYMRRHLIKTIDKCKAQAEEIFHKMDAKAKKEETEK